MITTFYEHLVAEYARISIPEVQQLLLQDYLQLRKDAYIDKLSQSEKGQEYLRQCALYETQKPDRTLLWKLKGGEI